MDLSISTDTRLQIPALQTVVKAIPRDVLSNTRTIRQI